ncbi:facilitated trehalose transporter Tret1 [Cephus cinctus]|uniref:Facilitated trehalose transporter Tret1 n=1 Tax=Cephus cinctus TaxID=211228 RepID=A0AAJ7BY41_CEPCN|nr:facilitated trehalose transporter Tret1 [Cephus cinctus]
MAEKSSKTMQIVATMAGNLFLVAVGTMMGWSSPILPKLQVDPIADDNPLGIVVSSEQGSWIGSLVAFGAIFGSIIAGVLGEKYGRKRALLLGAVPSVVGWILIGTATSIYQIYVARASFGLSVGLAFTVLPMYVGEIAEKSIRGTLSSLIQFFVAVGLLYAYSIGPYISYTLFWILCILIPILFFVSFVTMPESPYYLLIKGRNEEASQSLARLRGQSTAGVQKEIDELQVIIEEAYRNQGSYVDLFRVVANRKALIMTCALMFFQQFTGINVVNFYAESIFRSTGTDLSGSISTIIISSVQLLSSIVTPLLADRLGRKILLISSGVGSALTLSALGLFFYMKNVMNMDVSDLSWLPVVSIVIYMAVYTIGWGPLPWTVMGEMFASDVKSKASGISSCFCWSLGFLITKFFTNIETAFGTHSAFWMFGVCSLFSAVFVLTILPETKGKSLQEIQDELSGVRSSHLSQDASSSTKK